MIDQLIPLVTGGAGGLLGGNILGKIAGGSSVGVGSNTLIGIIGGLVGQYMFGPEVGSMIGAVAGGGGLDPMTIVGNLLAGAGGGGGLGLLWGIARRFMG